LPNFGSGRISRFAATRLLGIDKPLNLGLQADLKFGYGLPLGTAYRTQPYCLF
jgi:hypothetical protein